MNRPSRVKKGDAPGSLNATYDIDGKEYELVQGRCEMPAAPGSEAKSFINIFGERVWENLNGDEQPDIILVLVIIMPVDIIIENLLVKIRHHDRDDRGSMSTTPGIEKTMVLVIKEKVWK